MNLVFFVAPSRFAFILLSKCNQINALFALQDLGTISALFHKRARVLARFQLCIKFLYPPFGSTAKNKISHIFGAVSLYIDAHLKRIEHLVE
jgi:hypothetical protein